MKKNKIIVAGNILVDHLYPIAGYPERGQLTTILDPIGQTVGGAVCNVGIDLKRLMPDAGIYALGLVGQDVHDLEDLFPGMELPGIVTNITNFGAFVDIGLHENGLIHVSQMGAKGHAEPSKILKLHQRITVSVLDVDLERKRISLRLVKR